VGKDVPGGEPPTGATTRAGFRTYGKSKDSRDDLPQVVFGMAVTRGGIPVRVWCWPGNTSDSPLIRQVRDELRDWTLGKVIWVADRGFTSAANRRHLGAGGDGYILGEKLRSGSPEAAAALARPGRYQNVSANLRVKEVKLSGHERFVVCHNPDAADRDAAVRANLVDRLEAMIADLDRLSPAKRAELRGVISTRPGLTPTAHTDHSISTRPQAALPRPPARPSDRYDETGSAAFSTSICRSHDVTGLSAPTPFFSSSAHSAGGPSRPPFKGCGGDRTTVITSCRCSVLARGASRTWHPRRPRRKHWLRWLNSKRCGGDHDVAAGPGPTDRLRWHPRSRPGARRRRSAALLCVWQRRRRFGRCSRWHLRGAGDR
jgi:hypothetical protein